MKKTMKNTMKNTIAVFLFSMLACTSAALAWPWGNVGLNVDEPEAQLDVGGNVLVRSNLFVRSGKIQLGDGDRDIGYPGRISAWNGPEGVYDEFGLFEESSFAFGHSGGPKYGFNMNGKFGGDVEPPWYDISDGGSVVFKSSSPEETNTASIKVSVNPPGFIFNVNGVIWTNTP